MRTPTALLCVCAAFGSRSAKTTLEGRRAVKTPILTAIRNDNREWKRGREELRSSLEPPRPGPAFRAGAPSLFFRAVRSPPWVAPRVTAQPGNHSWLHHGFGAGSALRDFLDPRCDRSTPDLFGDSRLDGGAGAAIDGLSIATDDLPITIPSLDTAAIYDMPAESDYPDSDSDSEWDEVTEEERCSADRLFRKETREIEAFEARFDGAGTDAAAPMFGTAPPSSPREMAHTLFTTPTQDDLMTDILAELTQRYGVRVRLLGDVVDDSTWREAPLRTL